MNNLNAADIDQLTGLIDGLLIVYSVSSLILGALIGWYLRGRYESWYWLKHGVYCDDCAPLVGLPKKPVGYSYDCLNTSDCLCLKCFEALSNANNK